jgi:4-aminobutyrate aminotransferase
MAENVALDPQALIPRVIGRYTPVVVERAEGVEVWDRDGRRYLDFTSGIAVVNTGHCHPVVVKAIQEQAARVIHAQQNILLHEPMLQASSELTATMPESLDQVFWTNSGAEAVEGAIKLAKIVSRRPAIISFRGAFHGRTHAAMALTSSRAKVRGHYEPLVPSVYFAPYPYYYRSIVSGGPAATDAYCINELESLFETLVMPDDVAAIILESVIGEGGYLVPSVSWVQQIREICDRHGILMIMDEIQTGVGRTGKMWGFEYYGVVPDIVTVAKGIASGMPVSAVVANRELMHKWPPGSHGGTYGGNAVGTAAAAATLRVMRDERLPENAERMGRLLVDGLNRIQADNAAIGDIRGLGLMIAVELIKDDGSANPELVSRVVTRCLDEGVLLITCGTHDQAIRVIPPLVVNEQQVQEFLDVFERAIAQG